MTLLAEQMPRAARRLPAGDPLARRRRARRPHRDADAARHRRRAAMSSDSVRDRPSLPTLLRRLSWPELRHHPWRNGAALIAVMLGVALAFSVHLINASALAEFSAAVRSINGEPDFELVGPSAGFDEALYARVAAPSPGRGRQPGGRGRDLRLRCATASACRSGVLGIDALVIAALSPALLPRAGRRGRSVRRRRSASRVPQRRSRAPAPRTRRATTGSRCRRPAAAPGCASPAASPPAARRWR